MSGSGFTIKKPSKCMFGKCDWPYDTWHICAVFTGPEPVVREPKPMPVEQREKIAESARKRGRPRDAKRDEKIVKLYTEGKLGMRPIAEEVGCSYKTVQAVLKRNNIQRRPPGPTLWRPGNVHGAFN